MPEISSYVGPLRAIALTSCVLLGAFGVVSPVLSLQRQLDRLFASALVAFLFIVLGLESLSLFHAMSLGPVVLLSTAFGGVGLTAWFCRGKTPLGQTPADGSRGDSKWERLAITLGGMLAGWALLYYLLRGLLLPVMTVSDAPIYHLFFAVRWWQAGWIELVPTPFGELAASYFPANGDLWLTWLVITEEGGTLAKVGQWPFAFLGGLAIHGLGRQCGVRGSAAMVPAVLWLTTFLVLFSASLANVDLIFGVWFLVAVYFWTRFREERQMGDRGLVPLLFASLASGIVVGTKSVGLAFVALLLGFLLPSIGRGHGRWTRLAIVLLGIALPSAFWFSRNLWLTGNPLYPLELRLFEVEWLRGWYTTDAMKQSGYHLPPSDWPILLDRLSLVVDLRLLWLWPVSLLVGLGTLSRRGIASHSWLPAWFAALAIAQVLLFWFVIPYNTQERFLLPALGLGIVPLALLVERRPWLRFCILCLVAWHLVTPAWGTRFALEGRVERVLLLPVLREPLSQGSLVHAAALPLGILVAGMLAMTRRSIAPWGAVIVLLAASMFATSPLRRALANRPELAFYPSADFGLRLLPAWLALEEATRGTPAKVAYAGTNLPYYLSGSHLRNRVRYVDVAGRVDWRPNLDHEDRRNQGLHVTSPNPWPDWYREQPNFDRWLEALDSLGVEFLFVARENRHGREEESRGPPPFPIELAWADAHPERFERLPTSMEQPTPWARAYRVKRPTPGE